MPRSAAGVNDRTARRKHRPAQPPISMRAGASTAASTADSSYRLKLVQARLGHASIQMTADTYGHLFPRGDDGAELAAAEKAFWEARDLRIGLRPAQKKPRGGAIHRGAIHICTHAP